MYAYWQIELNSITESTKKWLDDVCETIFRFCQSFPIFFSWNAWKHLFRIWTQWEILKPFSKVYKGSYYVLIFFWKKVNFAKDYLDSFVDSVSVHLLSIDSLEHLSHLIFDFAYNYWKLKDDYWFIFLVSPLLMTDWIIVKYDRL